MSKIKTNVTQVKGKTKHLLHFASLAQSVVSLTHPMLGGY
jgi:hypothetical protein